MIYNASPWSLYFKFDSLRGSLIMATCLSCNVTFPSSRDKNKARIHLKFQIPLLDTTPTYTTTYSKPISDGEVERRPTPIGLFKNNSHHLNLKYSCVFPVYRVREKVLRHAWSTIFVSCKVSQRIFSELFCSLHTYKCVTVKDANLLIQLLMIVINYSK